MKVADAKFPRMSTVGDCGVPTLPLVPTYTMSERSSPTKRTLKTFPRPLACYKPAYSSALNWLDGSTPVSFSRPYTTMMKALRDKPNHTRSGVKEELFYEDSSFHDFESADHTRACVKEELYDEDSSFPGFESTMHTEDYIGGAPSFAECESESTSTSKSPHPTFDGQRDRSRRTNNYPFKLLRINLRVNGRGEPQGLRALAAIIKVLQTIIDKFVEDSTTWSKITPEVKYSICRELQSKIVDGEKIAYPWILQKGKGIHNRTRDRKRRQLFREYCQTKNSR